MHLIYSAPVHVNLRLVDAMGAASGTQSEGRTRMRKLICLAAVAALALTLGAGSAAAQSTVYDYDDAAMWWASFDCAAMKRILPMATGETSSAHEARACSMTLAGLKTPERRAIEDFVTALESGPHLNHKAFWNHATNATCLNRARVAGITGLEVTGVTLATAADAEAPASGSLNELLYCVAYDGSGGLRASEKAKVDMYLTALSGRAGMMTDDDEEDDEEEAPALPLVGVGILGLLLAGRGAWLRRRA